MSVRRLDLGFQPRPRVTRAAMGMLLVGVVCASVVVGHYQVTLGRLARAQAESLASHRERPGIDPRRMSEVLQRANVVALELARPWDRTFAALEAADQPGVAVLAIDPDPRRDELRITAESQDPGRHARLPGQAARPVHVRPGRPAAARGADGRSGPADPLHAAGAMEERAMKPIAGVARPRLLAPARARREARAGRRPRLRAAVRLRGVLLHRRGSPWRTNSPSLQEQRMAEDLARRSGPADGGQRVATERVHGVLPDRRHDVALARARLRRRVEGRLAARAGHLQGARRERCGTDGLPGDAAGARRVSRRSAASSARC